jgi:hypothetical protein
MRQVPLLRANVIYCTHIKAYRDDSISNMRKVAGFEGFAGFFKRAIDTSWQRSEVVELK